MGEEAGSAPTVTEVKTASSSKTGTGMYFNIDLNGAFPISSDQWCGPTT